MPQLDPSSYASQIFWLVVTFVILYLLMWKVALPRVSALLRERQERIDDDLEKASRLKAEAEEQRRHWSEALQRVAHPNDSDTEDGPGRAD